MSGISPIELKRYDTFLKTWRVRQSLLKMLPTLVTNYSSRITLTINALGECYTDGQNIVLSLLPFFFDKRYDEQTWFMAMRAAEAHECQHINSTDIGAMKAIGEWYGDYLKDKFSLPNWVGRKIAPEFLNIFEDGRIEQIIVTHHAGLKMPLLMMNTEMFRGSKLEKPSGGTGEFTDFQNQTLCYAKLGRSIRGFGKLKGTEFFKNFMAIRPHIDAAVNGRTCADCIQEVKESLVILAPYFAELFRADAELMEMLKDLTSRMSGGTEETEFNDGDPNDGLRNQSGGKSAGSGNTKHGSKNNYSSDGNYSKSSGCPDNDIKDEELPNEMDESELPYSEKELFDALNSPANAPAPPERSDHNELSDKEKKELEDKYSSDYFSMFSEQFEAVTPAALPPETNAKASALHRKLTRIMQQKASEQRGQRKGVLDSRSLWKVGTNSPDVFYRRGRPLDTDCAVFELIDNSGSMGGAKFKTARLVGGALEVALHKLAALKVSLFSVVSAKVLHTTVKDFSDIAPKGKSATFGSLIKSRINASGGNKDGYSIRVATRELLKRPEKRKILIVLSDGLPSDYAGGYKHGVEDVRNAVKEARNKGIIVVAFLVGEAGFVQKNRDEYIQMYGRSVIACQPEDMLHEFEKLFTQLIKQA